MHEGVTERLIVHGLDLSYFTGKIEAYLRAKGLPYTLRELDVRSFRDLTRRSGVAQMPQIEHADGRLMVDTPCIIDAFEAAHPTPSLTPGDPTTRLLAHLLEDYGDEWLWRPALYFRWAFADDAWLMSGRIARGMLRDLPLPFLLRRLLILERQRRIFMREDGVTRDTAPAIETLYLDTLDALEAVFATRPFLLGHRPSRADLGFFGSMFRHFFCDPTPGKVMRAEAPSVAAWVARLWAIRPQDFAAEPEPSGIPDDLAPIAEKISAAFLPYCASNAAAFAAGRDRVSWRDMGVWFTTPVNPYRVWRFDRLITLWREAPADARIALGSWLGPDGAAILDGPRPARLPEVPRPDAPRDRAWTGRRDRIAELMPSRSAGR